MNPNEALEVFKNIPCGIHCVSHHCENCRIHKAYKTLEEYINDCMKSNDTITVVMPNGQQQLVNITRVNKIVDSIFKELDNYKATDSEQFIVFRQIAKTYKEIGGKLD